jgi:hypothetical protein
MYRKLHKFVAKPFAGLHVRQNRWRAAGESGLMAPRDTVNYAWRFATH